MSARTHPIGLKLFIFLLVAMMIFSAIGVMVIYLRAPNPASDPNALPQEVTPKEQPTITIPAVTGTTVSGDLATGTNTITTGWLS